MICTPQNRCLACAATERHRTRRMDGTEVLIVAAFVVFLLVLIWKALE